MKKAKKSENYSSLNPDILVSSSWSDGDDEIIKHDNKSHKKRANVLETRFENFNKKKDSVQMKNVLKEVKNVK